MRTKRTVRKQTRRHGRKSAARKHGSKPARKTRGKTRRYNRKGGSAWKNAYQGVVNAAKSSIASARSTIDSTTGDAKNWSMVKRYQAKKAACKRLGCCPDQQM